MYNVIKRISSLRCPLESKPDRLISTGIHWGECSLSNATHKLGMWYDPKTAKFISNIPGLIIFPSLKLTERKALIKIWFNFCTYSIGNQLLSAHSATSVWEGGVGWGWWWGCRVIFSCPYLLPWGCKPANHNPVTSLKHQQNNKCKTWKTIQIKQPLL